MKESKIIGEIINQHYPLTQKTYSRHRWVIAQSRTTQTHRYQRMRNECTETAYHRIITAVKTLYLKPNQVYFERNYKNAGGDCLVNMHCLMSETCYLYLECDFFYDFQVEYAFNNCPFQAAIQEMLKPHPLNLQAKEIQIEPDFNTYFERMLKFQDCRFIGTLQSPPKLI